MVGVAFTDVEARQAISRDPEIVVILEVQTVIDCGSQVQNDIECPVRSAGGQADGGTSNNWPRTAR